MLTVKEKYNTVPVYFEVQTTPVFGSNNFSHKNLKLKRFATVFSLIKFEL